MPYSGTPARPCTRPAPNRSARTRASAPRRARSAARSAFTLLELLIVLIIIVILIGITLAVGSSALTTSREAQTRGVIRSLDQLLDSTLADLQGGQLPTTVVHPSDDRFVIPVADARNFSSPAPRPAGPEHPDIINTAGLFLYQAEQIAGSRDAITGLNLPTLERYFTGGSEDDDIGPGSGRPPGLITPIDAWGRPIRFVHPAFAGDLGIGATGQRQSTIAIADWLGQPPTGVRYVIDTIRRKIIRDINSDEGANDADGGVPINQRPYFYSSGKSGLTGYGFDGSGSITSLNTNYNLDNVYTEAPAFPTERLLVSDDLRQP